MDNVCPASRKTTLIVDPETGGVLSCVLETETIVRNQTLKQETEEQETESDKQDKSRQIRRAESDEQEKVTQRVQSRKEITREIIASVPIPETSRNIIFSSHKVADMP